MGYKSDKMNNFRMISSSSLRRGFWDSPESEYVIPDECSKSLTYTDSGRVIGRVPFSILVDIQTFILLTKGHYFLDDHFFQRLLTIKYKRFISMTESIAQMQMELFQIPGRGALLTSLSKEKIYLR